MARLRPIAAVLGLVVLAAGCGTEAAATEAVEVDLVAVVVGVELGDGWTVTLPSGPDATPYADGGAEVPCPPVWPRTSPGLDDCPLIGPATLILDTGERLEVPADTPGDPPCLLDVAAGPDDQGDRWRCEAGVGLDDAGRVTWIDVWAEHRIRRQRPIEMPGGTVVSITADGWAVTYSGWAYRLADEITTTGCDHYLGVDSPTTPTELRRAWARKPGTLVSIDPTPPTTTATIASLTCARYLSASRLSPTTTTGEILTEITHPHLGSGDWSGVSVTVENPCDTAIRVELRLASPEGEEQDPANIATVRPGRTAKLMAGWAKDTGPRDIVVTAPELGWSHREAAEGTVVVSIDPAACPG